MFAALLLAAVPAADRPPLLAPRPAAARAERFAELADRLGDDDFSVREDAAARLERAGVAAADALVKAAADADPERRSRAVEVLARSLQRAARRDDGPALLVLMNALKTVAEDPAAPADGAAAARATLDRFPTSATKAAVADLRAGGAAVMRQSIPGVFGMADYSVTFDDRWTDGEDGLAALREVAALRRVYYTEGALTDAARADLRAGKYGTFSVERRGRAFLGIQFSPTIGNGCVIEQVTGGGPADRAGLRGGDQILSFGGEATDSPAALLDAIREIGRPGVPAEVRVRRGFAADVPPGTEQTVTVTLSRWPDGAAQPRGRRGVRRNFGAPPPNFRVPRLLIPDPAPPGGRRPAVPEPPGVDPADGGDTPD